MCPAFIVRMSFQESWNPGIRVELILNSLLSLEVARTCRLGIYAAEERDESSIQNEIQIVYM